MSQWVRDDNVGGDTMTTNQHAQVGSAAIAGFETRGLKKRPIPYVLSDRLFVSHVVSRRGEREFVQTLNTQEHTGKTYPNQNSNRRTRSSKQAHTDTLPRRPTTITTRSS